MIKRYNFCLATDSYKEAHPGMMVPNTTGAHSYFEAREGAKYPETVFCNLQGIVKDRLMGVQVTPEKIDFAEMVVNEHMGQVFNREGFEYIWRKHGGRLPLRIRAVQEGTPVPIGNCLMTVENTDPNCAWLVNFPEPILTHVWSASTVASKSRFIKLRMKQFLDKTSDNPSHLDFMLHDFGLRGAVSYEGAEYCGSGHLINFKGTDNLPAVVYLMSMYGANVRWFSVPATEHSIMTAKGRAGEMETVGRLLKKYPKGILAIVIDSYDWRNFITQVLQIYGPEIMARDGKVVFRPDSGKPLPVTRECLEIIGRSVGITDNSKGYKVIPPQVGCLWGDGIKEQGIFDLFDGLAEDHWAADNMVIGMGGGLLQDMTRDTQRFAFKSSWQEWDGEGHDILKDPIDGSKKSKAGLLELVRTESGLFDTKKRHLVLPSDELLLETVLEDGDLIRDMNFDQVQHNARI